jgi:UDP-N-acetylglucosamine 2-epimerase (hydrolysing)
MKSTRKIVFLSGTRAEYGKLKPLIEAARDQLHYDVHIFVTGMHMLEKYGGTAREILNEQSNVYLYNNQVLASQMDVIVSNTIYGFSYYVKEIKPDLIVIHGDRPEALAGAIVGTFNNIPIAHIEGGEISGTVDEMIRHSVSKLAHLHFVANEEARGRLLQMGEDSNSIFVIGSPDLDVMFSDKLPEIDDVRKHYQIDFPEYAILLFHPVTTERDQVSSQVKEVVEAVIESKMNYIVIYPNNDVGSDAILGEYQRFSDLEQFRMFPSLKFEGFLTLLKNSRFVIGNSSAGIREAPLYGIPTVNIGSRQNGRFLCESIINTPPKADEILQAIGDVTKRSINLSSNTFFGDGNSVQKFIEIIQTDDFWNVPVQKRFVDR